jgi:hypothetical protein
MVIVNEGPPAGAVLGLSVVMTGGGTVITKLEEFDIMLPGFVTVTFAVPIFATSDAGTAAVNCVEEINVVGNAVPFQLTTEPVTNPDPLTVRVKPGLPAGSVAGLKLVMVGGPLLLVIVN